MCSVKKDYRGMSIDELLDEYESWAIAIETYYDNAMIGKEPKAAESTRRAIKAEIKRRVEAHD